MAATFLAYTLQSFLPNGAYPWINIGTGGRTNGQVALKPNQPTDDSYWIVILNAQNPGQKVMEWIVPGKNNAVPSGIQTYMDNPAYIFAVLTQSLFTPHVPLDGFYNFLANYGAGPQLQMLEQLHSAINYGSFAQAGYILTGGCGPRSPIAPPSYELAAITGNQALMMMSLESPGTGLPYSISDTYTWIPRLPPY